MEKLYELFYNIKTVFYYYNFLGHFDYFLDVSELNGYAYNYSFLVYWLLLKMFSRQKIKLVKNELFFHDKMYYK